MREMNASSVARWLLTTLCCTCGVLLLLLLLIGSANAQVQDRSATDGKTPLALQPGAPAGSYALSGFDNINYYNGNLNFHLPLLEIGGRGTAQMTMMLKIDSKGWHIKHHEVAVNDPECPHCQEYANVNIPEPNAPTPTAGFGAGVLFGRASGTGSNTCNGQGTTSYTNSLTRLTFVTPDGTEYELRDQLYNGQPQAVTGGICNGGRVAVSRGTIFTSADGNAATFISDEPIDDKAYAGPQPTQYTYPSGYLMLRDGTRYRIDDGQITWMRDRNGNLLSFSYSNGVMTITDSLNRQVTVEAVNDVAPYGACTKITFRGSGGAQRVIRVSGASLSQVLRTGFTAKTYGQLFPELYSSDYGPNFGVPYNPWRVSAVWLPDGRNYKLFYNSYGELARLELPTGGAIEYDYTAGSGCIDDLASNCTDPNSNVLEVYRRVTTKRVYKEGGTLDSKSTIGDAVVTHLCEICTTLPQSVVTVDHLDAANHRMVREKHYFFGDPMESLYGSPTGYPSWNESLEFKTEIHEVSSTEANPKVLRRVENTWEEGAPLPSWIANYYNSDWRPGYNVRTAQTVTTLMDTGGDPDKVSKQTFTYDQYNNRTDVYEYDYGNGAAGVFRRRTHTDYLTTNPVGGVDYDSLLPNATNPDVDATIHIRDLPAQQWISQDAAGSQKKSITTYEYDNYTADATHASLVARTAISGLGASFTTNKKTRGNVTALSHRLIQENKDITASQQYDVAGNVVKAIDANLNLTTFTFTDNFGSPTDNEALTHTQPTYWLGTEHTYAFVTQVKNALNQIVHTQYDYYLGKPVNAEDANGTVYSGYYNESLDRPTQLVTAYANTSLRHQTKFTYDDINRTITTTSDRTNYNDNQLKSEMVYDGLGRTIKKLAYEEWVDVNPPKFIEVDQEYDALGRVRKQSNPYRPYLGEAAQMTQTTYDELGRVVEVKTPDNAKVSTSYSGNTVTVRDQANKDRQSTTDALGRLTQVIEDPGTGGLNYQTAYSYDVLDDLLTVEQDEQTRTFTYDSLRRLTQATNPENGTIKYEYDDNGNLLKKIDPRKVTTTPLVYVETTLAYDALNRVSTKSYNNGTPAVTYTYDNATLPSGAPTSTEFTRGASVGRLVAVTYGTGGTGSYYGYDVLGRINQSLQKTDTQKYSLPAYTYDRAGNLLTEQYPSGRVVKSAYDGAGRLSTLLGTKDGATKTYASQIAYASNGAVSKVRLGNGLWEHTNFNTRLQPTEIGLGLSALVSDQLKLTYDYGAASVNNGNPLSQTIRVEAISGVRPLLNLKQTYTYDELNRLKTATEINQASANAQTWKQTYAYDPCGNRTINAAQTTSSMVGLNPSISSTTNRISKAGYAYDLAGNLTLDEINHTYQYDAESRMVTFDAGEGASYIYDGEGHRVKKVIGTGSLSVTTIFVYDAMSKLIAEYTTNTANSDLGTRYLTADHLGSTRIVTDGSKIATTQASANSLVKARYDYLPFGEEINSSIGGRSAISGFTTNDKTRQKFATYERDDETGLDYAQARYYANSVGRFNSPDDFLNDTHISDPQSWNLYVYVGNNPLRFIDPTGQIQTNADGTIKFTPDKVNKKTGQGKENDFIYQQKVMPDGSTVTIKWKTVKGSIYADNGKKITAYKATTPVSVEFKDANGKLNAVKTQDLANGLAARGDDKNNADCHGNTFAKGEVWIDNGEVKKIIENDGYRAIDEGEAPQKGDVGVFAEGKKFDLANTQHSVLINNTSGDQVVDVISKGGITTKAVLSPGAAWNSADNRTDKKNTQLKYFTKRVKR